MDASLENSHVNPQVHSMAEQAILFLACAVLGFGVLAFGAVQEWALCVLECGAALLFGLWAGYQIVLQRIRLTSNALIPALLLLSLPILQLFARDVLPIGMPHVTTCCSGWHMAVSFLLHLSYPAVHRRESVWL